MAYELTGKIKLYIPLGGTVDVEKETSRIEKRIEDLKRHLGGIDKKLKNKHLSVDVKCF